MSLLKKLIPPRNWQVPVVILCGAIFGLGFFILRLSNAASYLGEDPRACINCHVMTPQYITWEHSSHREVATCNDCHVPQDNVVNKYYFKAKDGLYHATIFTLRLEPQAIKMKPASIQAVQNNCIRCHFPQVTDAKMAGWVDNHLANRTERTCWECHRHTPHGRVRSLSATGFQIEPLPVREQQQIFVPEWLEKAIKENSQP